MWTLSSSVSLDDFLRTYRPSQTRSTKDKVTYNYLWIINEPTPITGETVDWAKLVGPVGVEADRTRSAASQIWLGALKRAQEIRGDDTILLDKGRQVLLEKFKAQVREKLTEVAANSPWRRGKW